jgi:hypothetical protein
MFKIDHYDRNDQFCTDYRIAIGLSCKKMTNKRESDMKIPLNALPWIPDTFNGRIFNWKLLLRSLFRRPGLFPKGITYAINGLYFLRVFELSL